jgi:hypothetical protein
MKLVQSLPQKKNKSTSAYPDYFDVNQNNLC